MPEPHYGPSSYQGPGIYRHYKGGTYEVVGIAIKEDSVDKASVEDDEIIGTVMVIYTPLSSGSLLPKLTRMDEGMSSARVEFWARDLDDFNGIIELDHNNAVRRFVKYGSLRSSLYRRFRLSRLSRNS